MSEVLDIVILLDFLAIAKWSTTTQCILLWPFGVSSFSSFTLFFIVFVFFAGGGIYYTERPFPYGYCEIVNFSVKLWFYMCNLHFLIKVLKKTCKILIFLLLSIFFSSKLWLSKVSHRFILCEYQNFCTTANNYKEFICKTLIFEL